MSDGVYSILSKRTRYSLLRTPYSVDVDGMLYTASRTPLWSRIREHGAMSRIIPMSILNFWLPIETPIQTHA